MTPPAPHGGLDDVHGATRAMRARGRKWALMLGANALLLGVMLGGPYVRGLVRTRTLWTRFADVAACVLGGRPAADPGLGLPHGAREHFAARVMHRPKDWPARCGGAIASLVPEPVTFLLPSVKTAELDLEATAKLLQAELAALGQRDPASRVSERPMQALEKVRAALARHATAAGALSVPEGDAIRFDEQRDETGAARVPLYASADAEVWWHGTGTALSALALDRRGLTFVRVQGGGMIERRASRPSRLRSLTEHPGSAEDWARGATLVWAMREAACEARADGCARKTVGVAPLDLPFDGLPEPLWLASHPSGRVDRSVWREDARVHVLAADEGGGLQVRVFDLPVRGEARPDTPPLSAVESWPAIAGDEGLLLPHGRGALAWAVGDEGTEFWSQAPGEAARELDVLSGEGAWALSCGGGQAGALGTRERLRLWSWNEAGAVTLSATVRVPLSHVVHDDERFRDRARVVCRGEEPLLVLRAADDRLALLRCDDEGCEKRALASHVQFFDAVVRDDALVVAYASSGGRAQVLTRVLDLAEADAEPTPPLPPAPCWVGGGGLCGLPRLLSAGPRLLLSAREGTDLRVMQSEDAGLHWTPMRGLRKAAPR